MGYKDVKRELSKTNKEFRRVVNERDLAFEISELVVKNRIAKGVTQVQLAEMIGTKQSGVSRVERGSALPSIALLEKIAKALGTELSIDFTKPATKTSVGSFKHSAVTSI